MSRWWMLNNSSNQNKGINQTYSDEQTKFNEEIDNLQSYKFRVFVNFELEAHGESNYI